MRRPGGAQGPGRGAGVRGLVSSTGCVEGSKRVRTGLHVCRGNWSRDESTLLRGSYASARCPTSSGCTCGSSSWSTRPSGPGTGAVPGKELGLGVVNPRTDAWRQRRRPVRDRAGAGAHPAGAALLESRLRLRHVLQPAGELAAGRCPKAGGDRRVPPVQCASACSSRPSQLKPRRRRTDSR